MPLFEVTTVRILVRHDDFQRSKAVVIFSCVLATKAVITDILKSELDVHSSHTLCLFLASYLLREEQFPSVYIILHSDKAVT